MVGSLPKERGNKWFVRTGAAQTASRKGDPLVDVHFPSDADHSLFASKYDLVSESSNVRARSFLLVATVTMTRINSVSRVTANETMRAFMIFCV